MNYNVISTQRFSTEIKRLQKKYPSIKEEFAQLIELLENNPITVCLLEKTVIKSGSQLLQKAKVKVVVPGLSLMFTLKMNVSI
jgi:mRNA-degrading endonuclease RelE of RelBE toxin-antitoxin system